MSILEKLFHKKEIAEKQRKYDEYKEKFKELGMEFIYVYDIGVNYLDKIYDQIVLLFDDNPEIPKGFLTKIYVGDQEWYDNVENIYHEEPIQGSTRWYIKDNKLQVSIFICTDTMTEHDFWKRRVTLPIRDDITVEATVTHEFAHVMEYYLLYCRNHWENTPTIEIAYKSIRMEENDKELDCFISEEIEIMNMCRRVINKLGVPNEFKYRPIATVGPMLGGYANTNYQEMFAEALAQYYCSDEPLPVSKLVYDEFKKLKIKYMKK